MSAHSFSSAWPETAFGTFLLIPVPVLVPVLVLEFPDVFEDEDD